MVYHYYKRTGSVQIFCMKTKVTKTLKKIAFPVSIIVIAGVAFWLANPTKTKSANLTSASATLSNSRLSYKANITSGTVAESLITIDGSGAPDNDTDHLFPNDAVCFTQSIPVGCHDDIDYTVVNTPTTTTFNVSPVLGTTLLSDEWAIATQSGTIAIQFTLANDIPSNGDMFITIPMADNIDGNDNFPDHAASTSTGGFDLGGVTTSNVSVTESCGGTFTVQAVTEGSGTSNHTILINNSTAACATDSVLTVTVGDATNKPVNPPPITSGHNQGEADIYSINVLTRDGSDNAIDEADVLVAPVEAVLISATVDETMSFLVCGVETDRSNDGVGNCDFSTPADICGETGTLSFTTTPMSVPFGTLTTADSFTNGAQYLKVGTNADSGYTVTIQQDDQLGKDGETCTGNPTDPVTSNCIPDNPGASDGVGSLLDYNASDDCDAAATNGLCYSMDDGPETGSPTFGVKFETATGDCIRTDFCARSAADQENGPETPQNMFTYNNPVSDSDAFVCWRMSIDAIQPAGYYFNKVKYIATPIF